MKRMSLWSLLVFALPLCQPILARAPQAVFIPIYFGAEDTIRDIQPIAGTDYILCHKLHVYYFFGGLYLTDDGYVLRKKVTPSKYTIGRSEQYYPLTPEKVTELQQAGVLPSPLPGYSLSTRDYIAGYSLWLFLAFVVAVGVAQMFIRRLWNRYAAPEPE